MPGPAVVNGQSLTRAIRIGLIGCGKRGTGAVAQALRADPHAELVAIGDVDPSHLHRCLATLKKISKIANRVQTESRQFVGVDAYSNVLQSDIDLVMLATPPAFRPLHLAASVDAGKHIFCEKPAATDPFGVRWVLQSVERAKAKNLSVMSGLCRRYDPTTQEMFQALSEGVIGRVTSYHATYFSNRVKPMLPASARSTAMADTEWQIRNWYNFVWLSGDGLVEQAVHSADRISWAMDDQPPMYCTGSGGCAVPTPEGNIYDHFSITYTYPNGVQAVLNSRQIDGCFNGIYDDIIGTEGTCTYGRGPYPIFQTKNKSGLGGKVKEAVDFVTEHTGSFGAWLKTRNEADIYQVQQNVLMSALRNNQRIDDGQRLANSTLLAIMGRTAAYTGQQITWDQMLQSDERLGPEHVDWNAKLKVAPRALPGLTRFG